MSAHLERARFLFEQARHEAAEQELRALILQDPEESTAHAYLALVLSKQQRLTEAQKEADLAVHLDPENGFPHYVRASVLEDRKSYKEAKSAIENAIRLEADRAALYGLLSRIHIAQKEWRLALKAAEQGLELDAESVSCTNYRALALTKLGEEDRAASALDVALSRDPEDALTHTNKGWALLHQGDYREALTHFREALRIDPQFEWARNGVVEALQARNPVYRIFLRYLLWMSKLQTRAQWALVLGLFFAMRILRNLEKAHPDWSPFIEPILWSYAIFVLFSWTAQPFFNLLLRLHPVGKFALSKNQIRASNGVGVCVFFLLLGIVLLLFHHPAGFFMTIGSALLTLPVSIPFQVSAGKYRLFLMIYTVALAGLFVLLLVAIQFDLNLPSNFIPTFFLGCFIYTWVANIGLSRK